MRSTVVSHFWKLASCNATGYVEAIGVSGIFIKNPVVRFRITSSNVAEGEIYFMGITSLTNIDKDTLTKAMNNHTQLTVQMEEHLLGSPWKGDVFGPSYIFQIIT